MHEGKLDELYREGGVTKETEQTLDDVRTILKTGGRYLCITFAPGALLNKLLDHFSNGWLIRVHKVDPVERSNQLPLFVFVFTKTRLAVPSAGTSVQALRILELCLQGVDFIQRSDSLESVKAAVQECQAYSVIRRKLGEEFVLCVVVSPNYMWLGEHRLWSVCCRGGECEGMGVGVVVNTCSKWSLCTVVNLITVFPWIIALGAFFCSQGGCLICREDAYSRGGWGGGAWYKWVVRTWSHWWRTFRKHHLIRGLSFYCTLCNSDVLPEVRFHTVFMCYGADFRQTCIWTC